MATNKDIECLRRNDERLSHLQLLRPEMDTSPSVLAGLIEALKINNRVVRVRIFVQRDFFPDDYTSPEEGGLHLERRLFDAVGSLPNLQELKIDSYTGVVSFPVDVLSRTLLRARKLKELELWDLKLAARDLNDGLDFERLESSLQNHPSLQKFTLYNCQLEENSQCTLDPFLHALATIPTLRQVYITAAAAASSASSSVAFSCSALDQLCRLTSLRELGLWKFSFPHSQEHHNTDAEPLTLMAPTIAVSNLECFEFGKCKLSRASDEALGEMLKVNTFLKELDLHLVASSSCDIVATASALETNTTLKTLKLWSIFSRKNQEALVHMIRNNYVLETCRLLDADPDVSVLIDFYISLNRKGRQKLLMNETTVNEWIEFLRGGAGNDLSTIFYYLSMKPGLCCLR